jgi:hypothetical protein
MATLPIPKPPNEPNSTQKIKSSWINNLQANTYVAPYGLMFFDTYDGVLRLGDGETQGGRIIGTGGGGNGTPAAPNGSLQFNNSGAFGGNISLTFDAANSVLSLTGDQNVVGNITVTGNIQATTNVSANVVYANAGIFLNANVITASYTLPPGFNGISGGPVDIQGNAVVTVPNGQRWTVV